MASTLLPDPTTTILATVTRAVAATVTVTASADPAVTPFGWAFSGAMGFANIGFVLFCILVIFILGDFNRLIAVPLVACVCNAIAAGCGWYAWESSVSADYSYSRRVACVLCEVFYKFATLTLNIYSFFLLEKILVGMQRRIFLSVFIVLYTTLAAFLFSTVPIVLRFMTQPDEKDLIVNGHLLDKLDYGDYITKAVIETWSAFFLLRTFYRARKRTRDLGNYGHTSLFKALMRSSELRVSSLVILGILKIVSYRTQDDVGVVLSGVGQFEFVMINLFPVLFLLDLMAARLSKLQASIDSATGRCAIDDITPGRSLSTATQIGTQSSQISNQFLGSPTGKGPVDSLRKEYNQYGMATWGRNGSLPTEWRKEAVAEVPEPTEGIDLEGSRLDDELKVEKG